MTNYEFKLKLALLFLHSSNARETPNAVMTLMALTKLKAFCCLYTEHSIADLSKFRGREILCYIWRILISQNAKTFRSRALFSMEVSRACQCSLDVCKIYEHIATAIIVSSSERIIFANKAARHLLGSTAGMYLCLLVSKSNIF